MIAARLAICTLKTAFIYDLELYKLWPGVRGYWTDSVGPLNGVSNTLDLAENTYDLATQISMLLSDPKQ